MLLTSPLSSPLKNPVRDAFSPAGGVPLSLTAQVQALFAAGRVGGMWDLGDIATLFQDYKGTPVTTVTHPIGLLLDKQFGLSRGSEIVSTPYSGSVSGTWSIGTTSVTRNGSSGGQATLGPLAAIANGDVLECSFVVTGFSGDSFFCGIGGQAGPQISGNGSYSFLIRSGGATTSIVFATWAGIAGDCTISNISLKKIPGNHATQPTAGARPLYQVVSSYGCAQFDATDDALLFPAITFGGEFNTFVAGKVTSGTQGVHLWRTADVNGTWAKYKSGDATAPTGTGSGSPTYAVNGTELSPSQQGQLYTQINRVDCVVESIGVELTAETALQLSGFVGSLFTGNAHRVLMISRTLTAGEKLLCRQWCAQGNGVTVV